MTFMLRDRPDGQIEIVVQRPTVVGVFADREIAEKVRVFLQDDEDFGKAELFPVSLSEAKADVAEAEAEAKAEAASGAVAVGGGIPSFLMPQPRQDRRDEALLPVAFARPVTPKTLPAVMPQKLTESQKDAAFTRLAAGEKLAVVAPDFGLTVNQLRGPWAAHKQKLQKHLAEGGQVACAMCQRHFTPSIASPDKCARCSHE